ncbi:MAG: hypothetical protein IPI65_15355 [Bacteroidetes bacterium]|nr:hypothetical protein [Bacteroidota bacterium]
MCGNYLKESGNPIYAVDISDHIYERECFTTDAKILRVKHAGAKVLPVQEIIEYIEFEITQPSNELRICNGNQSSKKYLMNHQKPILKRLPV